MQHSSSFLFIKYTLEKNLFSHLKSLAHNWTEIILRVTPDRDYYAHPEVLLASFDWIRDGAMAAIELGLPLQPECVLRLLSEQQYFESVLPISISDPHWDLEINTGTEVIRQWWLEYTIGYRNAHINIIRSLFSSLPQDLNIYKLSEITANCQVFS